jgi:hypothetical protein
MKPVLTLGASAMAAALILAAAGARADGLQAGLWRVTSSPELNGVAQSPGQNMRCLTAAEVADLDTTFSAVSRTTNSTCERVEHEFSPQRLKWRLMCKGQLDMNVAGEFDFDTPEHYTGTITASASMMGRLMQATRVKIEAQRVGDCG